MHEWPSNALPQKFQNSSLRRRKVMTWIREGMPAIQRNTNRFVRGQLIIAVLLAMATMAFVTGCGSSTQTVAQPAPTPTATPSPSPTPTPVSTPTPAPTPTPTPNANPSIASLSPNAATASGLAFTLTVNGANFLSGSQVQWNGNSRTTTFVSSSQ